MALNPPPAPRAARLSRIARALVSRRAQRVVAGALVLLALAAVLDGWRLWRLQRWNARITAVAAAGPAPMAAASAPPRAGASAGAGAAASAPAAADDGAEATVPELLFAQAHALAAQGAVDAAVSRYALVPADTPLGRSARFNGANLLLRQGLQLREGPQPGQALALIELAKEGYRELLRQDPAHWPARYNLERAQRLVPDPEDGPDEPAGPSRAAERAATTMRGYSPGLP